MKNPLILSLVALVFGAVALAFSLLGLTSSPARNSTAPVQDALHPDDALLLRVEALAEENRALRDRLSAVELRPVASASRAPVTDEFLPREEFDAFRDEVADALASGSALAKSTPRESAIFKEQVASTLSEIRLDETRAAIQKKLDGQVASLDKTMPRLESWLELTPQQSEAMRSALQAKYEREAELTRRWKEGEDVEILGELKRSDQQTHRDELSRILTSQQLETLSSARGDGEKAGGLPKLGAAAGDPELIGDRPPLHPSSTGAREPTRVEVAWKPGSVVRFSGRNRRIQSRVPGEWPIDS